MSDKPELRIVPSGTEAEAAAEFKKRILEAYIPICQLFDEVKSAGFDVNVGVGPGPVGRLQVITLSIAKHY